MIWKTLFPIEKEFKPIYRKKQLLTKRGTSKNPTKRQNLEFPTLFPRYFPQPHLNKEFF